VPRASVDAIIPCCPTHQFGGPRTTRLPFNQIMDHGPLVNRIMIYSFVLSMISRAKKRFACVAEGRPVATLPDHAL